MLPKFTGTTDETVAMTNIATRRFTKHMSSTPTSNENTPQQSGAFDAAMIQKYTLPAVKGGIHSQI